jgi:hypothetical protein
MSNKGNWAVLEIVQGRTTDRQTERWLIWWGITNQLLWKPWLQSGGRLSSSWTMEYEAVDTEDDGRRELELW